MCDVGKVVEKIGLAELSNPLSHISHPISPNFAIRNPQSPIRNHLPADLRPLSSVFCPLTSDLRLLPSFF
jgi:hypothetical protein